MSSGFGYQGPNRCYRFWQDLVKCYNESDDPRECSPFNEDYRECLVPVKERARVEKIIATARQQREARANKDNDDLNILSKE